ncbi:MAG: two-component system NarL family sensor kinase, partial [Roseivirga sp.]
MNAFQRNEEIKSLQSQAEAIGKSNLDSVLLLLNGAEKLATADELVAVESESEWVKAKTYYSLGDYEKSQRFALSAIEKATIVTNDTVLAKSYNLMGVLLKRAYKLDQAMAAYRKSLGYKERLSDSLGVSTTLQNLGGLFRTLGLLDSSYIYYQRSIEIKRALKDTVALASSIGGLGTYYYDIGQYKMAVDLFRQAYDVNVALDDKSKIALYAMNMGSGYRGLGYYELSLRNYLQSLTLYRSLGLRKEEGSALFNIASLYKLLKKFDVALEYYLKSLKIYEETNRDKDKADIYLSMGDLYLLEKRATEALEFFSQAEEIYTKNNELRDLALVRHGQGKAYARMEDYGKSKALYQESLLGLDQQNDKDEIGNVYSSLAVTNYKGKEYKEALKNYEVALNISQELKLPSLFKGALIGFAEIYQATGNSRKAYDYRLQYDVMKDSLDNVEKSRQIAELREIYESEKKDEQITQLELENELVSAKSQANAALADQQRTEKLIFIT